MSETAVIFVKVLFVGLNCFEKMILMYIYESSQGCPASSFSTVNMHKLVPCFPRQQFIFSYYLDLHDPCMLWCFDIPVLKYSDLV